MGRSTGSITCGSGGYHGNTTARRGSNRWKTETSSNCLPRQLPVHPFSVPSHAVCFRISCSYMCIYLSIRSCELAGSVCFRYLTNCPMIHDDKNIRQQGQELFNPAPTSPDSHDNNIHHYHRMVVVIMDSGFRLPHLGLIVLCVSLCPPLPYAAASFVLKEPGAMQDYLVTTATTASKTCGTGT